MSAEVIEWSKRTFDTGGGDGPRGPVIEARVAVLEEKVGRIELKLDRVESKLDRHDEAFRRVEDALKSLAEDNKRFSTSLADLREKVAHIDGRLANIPTFWQTLSLMAMLLIGIAGIIFTASRFLHP